ncbi:MAG: hypothetical protein WCI51_00655 [Lentisphaerota bacterium]
MKKRGIIIGFLLSLLAGIILGASGGIFLFPKFFPPPRPFEINEKDKAGGGPLPPDSVRKKIMERLDDELALSPAQKIQIEHEVKIFANELGVFHDANREKLIAMFEVFKRKLAALLSEEQTARLDKISRGICNPQRPPQRQQPAL